MLRKHTKRILILVAALFFFLLGLAGLVLPFLQGLLFLAVSAILLSILSPTLQEYIERQTRKYPKVHEVVVKIDSIIRNIVGEI